VVVERHGRATEAFERHLKGIGEQRLYRLVAAPDALH